MEYITHLKKDKVLATIIHTPVHEQLLLHKNIALRLMAAIMSQQLHTKVAAIIFDRFLKLCGSKNPSPQKVLRLSIADLRTVGLSNAKANYVHNVAAFCIEQRISDKKLISMDDAEIIQLLTQIKGVGKWTVEMLLMFSLGRLDIFAMDDWGLQQAIIKLYKIKTTDKKKRHQSIQKISEKWSPYRSYASLYLWQWKDEDK